LDGGFSVREMTMAFKICVTGVIVVVLVVLMGFMVIMGMVAWYRITVGEWNFAVAYIIAMLAGFWCWVNLIATGVWLWREG
jgi:hypothetical protein